MVRVPRSSPVSVDVHAIGAHSTLVPLGLDGDGSLAVPDVHHPAQASWYCADATITGRTTRCSSGVQPGQPGPAVIIGHVDGDHQQGVFYHLKSLKVGDTAQVGLADGTTLTFSAYRVLMAAKTQFPQQVVYGNTPGPELRLITCTGSFVGGKYGYDQNLVVFLTMIPNPP